MFERVSGYSIWLAGLLNVVGLMCYINRTNDELGGGNSKKEENIVQEYEYAWSFYMATVSFGFTEVSAVLCIYFYNELLRLAKHLTQHRTKAGAADSASIQHSNGPHASLSGTQTTPHHTRPDKTPYPNAK